MTEPLPPDTVVWTTGQNDPGYLPNPDDVRVFATQEQARADVADRIDELAETMLAEETDLAPLNYPDEESFEADTDRDSFSATALAENVRHNADLDYIQAFSVQVDNTTHTPPVFWAQPSTVGDYFGDDTESAEYADLTEEIRDRNLRQEMFTPRGDTATLRSQWSQEDLTREWNELRTTRIERGLPVLPQACTPKITGLVQ